jgi:hypothetical protein
MAAIVFGVWAPLSWQMSRIANLEAQTSNLNARIANQLSIIDFCLSNEVSSRSSQSSSLGVCRPKAFSLLGV